LASIASVTAVTLAAIYRPLVVECFDPGFLRSVAGGGPLYHMLFLALVVLNLVGGFLALGTLMAVGLMMLPAAAARFWAREVASLAAIATGLGVVSSITGLLLSYHVNIPSGPAIILVAGALYALSLLFGRHASARTRLRDISHLEA
jgi:zinc/manganese transport system permease protein